MNIYLTTDGKRLNLASSTDKILLSFSTDGVDNISHVKYEVFKRQGDSVLDKPFLVKESKERYEYVDANRFEDGEEYAWRAVVFTDKEKIVSDYAFFEKGVRQENFIAKWIDNPDFDGRVSEFENDNKKAYMAVNYTEPTAGIENEVVFDFGKINDVTVVKEGVEQPSCIKDGKLKVNLKSGEAVLVIVNE